MLGFADYVNKDTDRKSDDILNIFGLELKTSGNLITCVKCNPCRTAKINNENIISH